jgi:hypothetical protein
MTFLFFLLTGPLPDILEHKTTTVLKTAKCTAEYITYCKIPTGLLREKGTQVQPPVYYYSSTTMNEQRNHKLMNESCHNNSLLNKQNCNVQIHR